MAEVDAPSRHRRKGSRRDPAIDEAVLATTRELLVTRGYAATTIDLVATTAGVSRPAIYRRWASKAQLVHEAAFPDLGSEPAEDDLAAEIVRLCRGAIRMYRDPVVREAIPGVLVDLRADPRMRRLLGDRLESAARKDLARRVNDAVAGGTARAIDANALMDVIAGGAWYAVCVRRVKNADGAARDLAELILRGVLAS
ncbi:TetR/AcrR family transcriptional regulator [Mycolicibacterium sediminis]|uniref:TetR family transcriptional regulator n=1 Tax=Mycolicibacterium sediminis TaxID=1286180 RepID=A0A7I7QMN9_9MYCO|nr:TetR/AcrR family transcriptional regulator [Mycolicibacterium sediminis]BBY27247.1 TetR family transcriptional regulator [Mycolicibacterium sediminis]